MPLWLDILAWISLAMGGMSALLIVFDEWRHPQHMWIMNLVWPLTALYAGVGALWAYYRFGRRSTRHAMHAAGAHGQQPPAQHRPLPAITAAFHCGAGCTLGDILAEWGVFLLPILLTWFGYRTLFDHRIFATWIFDFILAFLLGIVFQYFTIAPMRHLPPGKGILQALKADTLSLTAWQLGMYGWMAIATFAIFGRELAKTTPVFWFMMQIAMLAGFLTSYPVNLWLVHAGIKEKM